MIIFRALLVLDSQPLSGAILPKIKAAPSSTFLLYVCGQLRHWRFSEDAQARLSLRCSHMRQVPLSHELAYFMKLKYVNIKFIKMHNRATINLFLVHVCASVRTLYR